MSKKDARPSPVHYDDLPGMLAEKRVTRLGLWIEANVWRGYSPTATWITDTVDRLPCCLERLGGWVVRTLGTGNYFDA